MDNMALIVAFVGRKYIRTININNSYYLLYYSFLFDNFYWHIYTYTHFFFFNEMNVSHKLPIIYKKIRIYIYINHFIRHYMARCLSLLLVESTPPANKNSLVSSARGREKCCSRSRSGKKLESKLLSEIIQSPSPSLFPPLHPPPPKKKINEGGGGRKNSGLDRNQNKHDHRRNKKYDIFGRN